MCRSALADVRCRAPLGASTRLESIDAETRLAFLRETLRSGARHARIWHYSWSGIYASLAAVQFGLLATGDRDSHINNYFGAGASLLGLSVLWIAPLKVMRDQKWLERRIARSPAGESPCALVAEAERLLERDAASEAFGKSALTHAGNFVLNIGLALAIGLGFGHWEQAAIQGPVGIAVGELQSFTQPRDVIDGLARYRRGDLRPPRARLPFLYTLAPDVGRDRAGLVFALSF